MKFLIKLLIIGAALVAAGAASAQDEAGERPGSLELLLEASEQGPVLPQFGDERAEDREDMVRDQIARRGVKDDRVLEVMRAIPRHEFVPPSRVGRAYSDNPLPIGHGQTISQPYIVGYMTERLELDADDRVLEVGTGSGYQAAVLAGIVEHVTTVEIIRPLAATAANRLERLGFTNVSVFHGDGYYGREEGAPYDAIIVTAAATHVPPPLTEQLKPGGRMVIPVGRSGWTQNLLLVEKKTDGSTATRNLMAVAFVPLTGGH